MLNIIFVLHFQIKYQLIISVKTTYISINQMSKCHFIKLKTMKSQSGYE